MSFFGEIEKGIERGFRRWTERMLGPAESGDLVTLHRAILEEVESQVQVVARGRRIFPFSRVLVTLRSLHEDRRTMLQGAFGERLGTDVRTMLEGTECEMPRGFVVEVLVAEGDGRPFEILYSNAGASHESQPAAPCRLTVLKGKASREEYHLQHSRLNIGRLAELTDSDHRVVRRNDVVFEEGADELNVTVSRRHAHIRFEEGDYRLCDDGSEFGTRVFREGRSIEVAAGDRRGEKLRAGDEIYLGRACLRFERK